MSKSKSRIEELKTRLDSILDPESFPPSPSLDRPREASRQKDFGWAMLVLGVFILAAGHYLSATDVAGRAVFLVGALGYAGVGAFCIDRANRFATSNSRADE